MAPKILFDFKPIRLADPKDLYAKDLNPNPKDLNPKDLNPKDLHLTLKI